MIYFTQILSISCIKRTLKKFAGQKEFKWCGLIFMSLGYKWWEILKPMKFPDYKCQLFKEDKDDNY